MVHHTNRPPSQGVCVQHPVFWLLVVQDGIGFTKKLKYLAKNELFGQIFTFGQIF